jgi:hypothetical protein
MTNDDRMADAVHLDDVIPPDDDCRNGGHDYDIFSTADGTPIKLACTRCGETWGVS